MTLPRDVPCVQNPAIKCGRCDAWQEPTEPDAEGSCAVADTWKNLSALTAQVFLAGDEEGGLADLVKRAVQVGGVDGAGDVDEEPDDPGEQEDVDVEIGDDVLSGLSSDST